MAVNKVYSSLWRSIFCVFGFFDDIQRRMEGKHSQFGTLSVSQTRLLRILRNLQDEHPEGVKLKELAEKLRIGSAAASEMVNGLCRKRLLCCRPCAEDRRAVSIRLSELVLDGEGEVDVAFSDGVRELCADFTDEELESLARLLERMCSKGRRMFY